MTSKQAFPPTIPSSGNFNSLESQKTKINTSLEIGDWDGAADVQKLVIFNDYDNTSTLSDTRTFFLNSDIFDTTDSAANIYGFHNRFATDTTSTANFTGLLAANNIVSFHRGSGNITNLASNRTRVRINSTGSITNLYGIYMDSDITAGTITNHYGLNILSPSYAGGTVTNSYGVLIGERSNASVTNAYGIYQAGSDDINYFEGNIGVGTNSEFGSGNNVIAITNSSTVPSTNPAAGGVLYVDGGALMYRGSAGTVTMVAPA